MGCPNAPARACPRAFVQRPSAELHWASERHARAHGRRQRRGARRCAPRPAAGLGEGRAWQHAVAAVPASVRQIESTWEGSVPPSREPIRTSARVSNWPLHGYQSRWARALPSTPVASVQMKARQRIAVVERQLYTSPLAPRSHTAPWQLEPSSAEDSAWATLIQYLEA